MHIEIDASNTFLPQADKKINGDTYVANPF